MLSSSSYLLIIGNQCGMGKAPHCLCNWYCVFLLTEEHQFNCNINWYKYNSNRPITVVKLYNNILLCLLQTFCCCSNADILQQKVAVLGSGMNCLWFAADTLKTQTSRRHPAHCSEDRPVHIPHKQLCLCLCDVMLQCYCPL